MVQKKEMFLWMFTALGIGGGLAYGFVDAVSAERYTSPSYTIDASVGNTFGGSQSSTNYKLTSSGGESVIGSGQGGSYKLTTGYVAQLEKSLQLNVQPNGLAAYYPLDENTGTSANDETANSNGGGLFNSPTWVAGKVGQSLSFNGTNQYAEANTITGFPTGNTVHTISAWVKVTALPPTRAWILLLGPPSAGSHHWLISSTGDTSFGLYNGSNTNGQTAPSITVGVWTYISLVYDGTQVKAYKDGALVGTVPSTGFNFTSTPLTIAKVQSGENYFNGSVDELKIFPRALSANEVKSEYDAGNAGRPAGLAFSTDLTGSIPQTVSARAVVQTDAPGYSLAISQNQNLTSGANSIPVVTNGGTIATPAAWTDGTTNGLGFTLTATTATALDTKWGTGANYAALPSTPTGFYVRSGYTTGTKDALDIRYKLGTTSAQTAGTYTNIVTYTGTMTP